MALLTGINLAEGPVGDGDAPVFIAAGPEAPLGLLKHADDAEGVAVDDNLFVQRINLAE